MKKGMNINLNIQKKDLWVVVAIVVLLVGAGVVVAYTTVSSVTSADVEAQAPIHGHSPDEIEIVVPTGAPTTPITGQMWLESP